jgi:membrane-associated protease RseP (regulator of RpoE activity)
MRSAGLIMLVIFGLGCSSGTNKNQVNGRPFPKDLMKSPSIARIAEPLMPAGRPFNAHAAPVIKHVIPGSPAQKLGLMAGDRILQVNGVPADSIAEFERKIKKAEASVDILFARGELRRNIVVPLGAARNFGAEFAPFGVQLIRTTSPLVSFYKNGPMTVHAQGSFDEKQGRLRLNFIIESSKPMKKPKVSTVISLKGQKSVLASISETLDAVGPAPIVLTKYVNGSERPDVPLRVTLSINGSKFPFEFQ